jgi:hypothetical protein
MALRAGAVVALPAKPETVRMTFWVVQLLLLATIPLAAEMARERNRSARGWAWTAVLIGPLAPVALFLMGDAKHPAPAN